MLFATMATTAQTRIGLSQDARLALLGDDKGNEAFTPNITLRASQAIRTIEWFSFGVYVDYEYADLQDTFHKWNFGFNPTFRLFYDKIELDVFYGGGRIYRGNSNKDFAHWELSGSISVKIKPRVYIFTELKRTWRSDLKPQKFVYSGFVGLRFHILDRPIFKD